MKPPQFDGSQPCASTDPEAWFPEPRSFTEANQLAVKLCGTCEFRQPCLDYALSQPRISGIWGGTTHNDRVALRREERAVA